MLKQKRVRKMVPESKHRLGRRGGSAVVGKRDDGDVPVRLISAPLLAKNKPLLLVSPQEGIRLTRVGRRHQFVQCRWRWVQQPFLLRPAAKQKPLPLPTVFLDLLGPLEAAPPHELRDQSRVKPETKILKSHTIGKCPGRLHSQ